MFRDYFIENPKKYPSNQKVEQLHKSLYQHKKPLLYIKEDGK